MSIFSDLDRDLLSPAIDDVFADKFSFAPRVGASKDDSRQQLHDIPCVLQMAGEVETGKSRAGSGRESKFAARFSFDTLLLDADKKYFPDGRPLKGDVFRSADKKYYEVDRVEEDGARWVMVVSERVSK